MKLIKVKNERKELLEILKDYKDELFIASFSVNDNFLILPTNIFNELHKELNIEIECEYSTEIYNEFKSTVNNVKPLFIGRSDFVN